MAVGDFFAAGVLAVNAHAALGEDVQGVAAVAFGDEDAFLFVAAGYAGFGQAGDAGRELLWFFLWHQKIMRVRAGLA